MDCGAVLLVSGLVHVLTFAHILWLALSLDFALIAGVEDGLALTVTNFAAALFKEGVLDCTVYCVISCATLRSLAIVTANKNWKNQIP